MEAKSLSKEIQTVFDDVIGVLNTVNEDMVDKAPFEGSWTIGQVAEHIIICSSGIPDSETQHIERPYNKNVSELRGIFSDMDQKSEAAPQVYPKETSHDLAELATQLMQNKEKLLQIVAGKKLTALCLDMEFPFMGYLTRYEWLTFVCVHTQRHLNQIRNIQQHLVIARRKLARTRAAWFLVFGFVG